MLAWAAIVLAVLASACARTPDRQLHALFDQAQQAMRRGEFAEACKLSDSGVARAPGGAASLWSWRFRLLTAETQILNREFASAESAITATVPSGREFDPIRGRQKFLLAKMSVPKGELKAARQVLAEARPLASGDDELNLDIDHLDG